MTLNHRAGTAPADHARVAGRQYRRLIDVAQGLVTAGGVRVMVTVTLQVVGSAFVAMLLLFQLAGAHRS